MDPAACRRAAIAAFVCAGLNAVAATWMLMFLRHGLPPTPAGERMYYLWNHQIEWRAGWCLWIATTLSLAFFYYSLHRALQAGTAGRVAVIIGMAGLAPDLTAQIMYIRDYPLLSPEFFESMDAHTAYLSACLGNGAYTLAWALLCMAAHRKRSLPWELLLFGLAGIAAGAGMTVAGALNWIPGLAATTAVTIPLFTLWAAFVGRFLWMKARAADTMSPAC